MSDSRESLGAALPLGRGVEMIVRDPNGLIALAKPAGVLSHPNEARDQPRSLLNAAYNAEEEAFSWSPGAIGEGEPAAGRLWLLNRLDSATSGVILAAANASLAREIRALFQQRYVKKHYNALVFGTPVPAQQDWRDRVAVQKKGGQIRTSTAGNVPAEAHMRVLRTHRGAFALALIELEPKTGRSHQLRVQCAKRHLPIVGDATYGDFRANRDFAKASGQKRLFLHSRRTAFDYRWKDRVFHFAAEAPLPPEFDAALTG